MIAVFHHFSTHFFWLSWFSFRLDRIFFFKCMTWQSIFLLLCFSFFILTICLLRATTYVIDGLPNWSIISNVAIVLEGLAIGSRLLVSFLSKGKIWLKSILEKWTIFGQTCLKTSIRVFSKYHDLRDLCFWSLKMFGRFEAVASLDAYQITNYQFPSKTHCHNGFPPRLGMTTKIKWSCHRSFLYGCDRSPGMRIFKPGTEIPNLDAN